jgi:uncharacterized protein YneF (UPF0154 family)
LLLQTTIILIVVLLLFVGVVAGARLARQFRRRRLDPPLNVDFTVGDLNEMLRKGQLTPTEFERAREIVLRRSQEREAEIDKSRGHAFAVIQKPLDGADDSPREPR